MPKLSIVIPVYNEANTISIILDKVMEASLAYSIVKEIIIVNDGSKDNSQAIIDAYIQKRREHSIAMRNRSVGGASENIK